MTTDDTFLRSENKANAIGRPRAFDTIVYGGLIVGVLDFFDATIFFGLRGSSTMSIFQFVASGLLGRSAFSGGYKTFLLGVLIHFINAFIIATIYYIASCGLPTLIRHPFIWGPLYGIVVHFVMTFVVTPLSAAPPRKTYPIAVMLNGVIGHALLVGLPIALLARRSAQRQNRER
jgi:hypothetical protein